MNEYIHEQYGEYTVLDDEQGVIPMSSLLPKKSKKDKWVNIGTRGGSVNRVRDMHLKICISMLSKYVPMES